MDNIRAIDGLASRRIEVSEALLAEDLPVLTQPAPTT